MCEWKDWATDMETNKRVERTVRELDEKEIDKFIENARKVLESVGYTHEYDCYEVHDYLDYIGYINKGFRYDIDDGCMTYLSMDILENRGLYLPYKEDFIDCLKKVAEKIDSAFLHFDREFWDSFGDDWEDEIDEDEYYLD